MIKLKAFCFGTFWALACASLLTYHEVRSAAESVMADLQSNGLCPVLGNSDLLLLAQHPKLRSKQKAFTFSILGAVI